MIFVDTSAFLAIENRRDRHHAEALAFRDAMLPTGRRWVTSDYVLAETLTTLRFRAGHAIAVDFGQAVRESGLLTVEAVSILIREEAWRIFKTFADKDFSFTDCTSFVLMERLAISIAFAFDDHFRQYGKFIVRP